MPQPSETNGIDSNATRRGGLSSIPLSPTRLRINEHSSSSSTTATTTTTTTTTAFNTGSSTVPNENGDLFTLTNYYTFSDNGQPKRTTSTDKYRIDSVVEVFDSPTTPHPVESAASYREQFSSKTTASSRQVLVNSDVFNFDASRIPHFSGSASATPIKLLSGS